MALGENRLVELDVAEPSNEGALQVEAIDMKASNSLVKGVYFWDSWSIFSLITFLHAHWLKLDRIGLYY